MKTPRPGIACISILAGALSGGCDQFFNFLPTACPKPADQSWVQEGELQNVYSLRLVSNHGVVTLNNICLRQGYFFEEKNQPEDGYQAVLVNRTGETIFKTRFKFPHFAVPFGFVEQAERTLFIPTREDAEQVDIYNPTCQRVTSIKVSELELKADKQ